MSLVSIRKPALSLVILRSPADSGTMKNLEILRGDYPACPGHSPGRQPKDSQ
jgi:hypothetical protein